MLDIDIQKEFSAIEHIKLEPHSFTFYTSVSVMSSSKIEGEQMEVDSYVKHKILDVEYLPEPAKESRAISFIDNSCDRSNSTIESGLG